MDTKIALITGGSRGLGRSMAMNLAQQGRDIVITYVKNEKEAAQVVQQIEKLGRKALALQLDVSQSAGFDDFKERLEKSLKNKWNRNQIHFLVNNAGTGVHASFEQTSEAQFDDLYKIHLKGTFFLTQKLLPLIAEGGSIINISSGLARFSFPGYAAYASMKGAIETLTRYLAKELGAKKIAVNTIAPGAIETDFGGGQVRDNKELNAMLASQTALGRVGLPDDIGGAVAMLLSDNAHWITGQRIEVSGGMML